MLYNEKLVLQHLKELRKEKKYTQKYVSNFLGIARGSYAKIENGINKINLENTLKLANLYNVTIDNLLCLSNDKDNKNLINNIELDTVLKTGITYNGKTLTSTDIIALKAFLQGLTSSK
ncbi:transcriptional regulator [Lactobacillus sp. UMNPBX2]|nr:transcriptional regulator [Lactobacillus sp. UMNPBX2]